MLIEKVISFRSVFKQILRSQSLSGGEEFEFFLFFVIGVTNKSLVEYQSNSNGACMGWLHAVQSKNKCLNPPCNCVLSTERAFPNINIYLFDYGPRVHNVTKEFGFYQARSGEA